jgi:excisionase family DNA binding protein
MNNFVIDLRKIKEKEETPKYLTVKQVAKLLGVTPLTVRNWDKSGKLKAIRHPINNYRLYRLEDIENFLKKLKEEKTNLA